MEDDVCPTLTMVAAVIVASLAVPTGRTKAAGVGRAYVKMPACPRPDEAGANVIRFGSGRSLVQIQSPRSPSTDSFTATFALSSDASLRRGGGSVSRLSRDNYPFFQAPDPVLKANPMAPAANAPAVPQAR